MKAVGVKVLKAKLSEYLRLVKSGETVLVTERDEVIAELRPAHRAELPASESIEDSLQAMAEDGRVTLRSEEPMGWEGFSEKFAAPPGTAQALLDEIRKDR